MSLEKRLAEELLAQHPAQSAAVLEALPPGETAALMARASNECAGALLRRLASPAATAALEVLYPDKAAAILHTIAVPTAAALLRLLEEDRRAVILAAMDGEHARGVEALLRHQPGTAAALMDPLALALPQDMTVATALSQVRESATNTRYNVYVIDRERRLVGVLNLRELLLAAPADELSDVMVRTPRCIVGTAPRSAVLGHPGWREAHSLPVVDEEGLYLGAIRYRTLRRLEDELRARTDDDSNAASALGSLFATGVGGLLDAVTGSTNLQGGRTDDRA